jgi:Ca2+-binding EF-hand superfamily protein
MAEMTATTTRTIDTKQQQQQQQQQQKGHFKRDEQEEEDESTTTTTTTILSAGELEEIRSAFGLFDVQNTGRLAVADLQKILRGMIIVDESPLQQQQQQQQHQKAATSSAAATAAAAQQLLDRLERLSPSSKSSSEQWFLSLDEFTTLLTTPHPNDPRDALAQVFDLFDTERKGYISLDNLRSVAVELGEADHCSESFLRQMMGEKDQVSLEDVRSILLSEKSSSTTTSRRIA